MTDPNKAAVLAKWPEAEHETNLLAEDPSQYHYIVGGGQVLGTGYTEPEAWTDAARRLNSTFQDRWQAESRRRA